jgi:hypothetical protein
MAEAERAHPDFKREGGSALQRERIARVAEMCCQQYEGSLVEIGCLLGGTSRILGAIAQKYDRTLYCIDYFPSDCTYPMQEYKAGFLENIKPFGKHVVFIEDDAHDPKVIARYTKEPVAFGFSDDDHSFLDHMTELRALLPVATGVVCVDDVDIPEVRRAVADAILEFPEWRSLYADGLRECWLVKK